GELKGLGVIVSATTVKKILRGEQLGPAGKRRGPTRGAFPRTEATGVSADFLERRYSLGPAVVRAVLHCNPPSRRTLGRMDGPSRRRVGHATGAAGHVDDRRPTATDSFF